MSLFAMTPLLLVLPSRAGQAQETEGEAVSISSDSSDRGALLNLNLGWAF